MVNLKRFGIAAALLFVMLGCNHVDQPSIDADEETQEQTESTITSDDVALDIMNDADKEIQELEKAYSAGNISEKDYLMRKEVLERVKDKMSDK